MVPVAWAVGIAALAMSGALALRVLALRQRRLGRERRRAALRAAWRPLLFEAILGGEPGLPPLAPRDEDSFLLLWNQLQDGLQGEARERLNQLARRLGAHELARARLERRDALGRLLGLRTLGHLGSASDYAEVVRYLDDPRAYLCLAGARALVHLDAARAPDDVLPRLASRVDWPVPLFAKVLSEADAARLSERLGALQAQASPGTLVRLLPLASLVDGTAADALLRGPLAATDAPEVLCAGLKRVRSPAHLQLVRGACAHEAWPVRTQAAAALGRIGELCDGDLLASLLGDRHWWVRYRAAQALTGGRFGPAGLAAERAARLGDRLATEIVEHALAEGRG